MSDECKGCEGIFSRNETIVELRGDRYCEDCYKELIENSTEG